MRRGFTLVEMLVTALIVVAILGSVIQLSLSAVAYFQRSEARLDPRESARLALIAVREALADSLGCEATAGGKRFVFRRLAGSGEVAADAGRLTLRMPGAAAPETLIASGVKAWAVRTLAPGYAQLRLELERPGGAPLVVFDEVHMAGAAAWDVAVPWNPVRDAAPPR